MAITQNYLKNINKALKQPIEYINKRMLFKIMHKFHNELIKLQMH